MAVARGTRVVNRGRFRYIDAALTDALPSVGHGLQGGTMAYDKQQATHEFNRWSESYDRGILQWLLSFWRMLSIWL